LNKPKRSLRSTLQVLTASLTEAILAAARESLFELADARPALAPRKERARSGRAAPKRTRAARAKPAPEVELSMSQASDAASDQVITDPLALLAALETAAPAISAELDREDRIPVDERELPDLLLPVTTVATPAPELVFVPALRAGEEIVRRTSGSSVVLRRRRI